MIQLQGVEQLGWSGASEPDSCPSMGHGGARIWCRDGAGVPRNARKLGTS
jgi:hypothetical protein